MCNHAARIKLCTCVPKSPPRTARLNVVCDRVTMCALQDGGRPCPAVKSNPAIIQMVCTEGVVHPQPSGCSPKGSGQLVKCWSFDPSQRPEFAALELFFKDTASEVSSQEVVLMSGQTAGNASDPAALDGAGYVARIPISFGFSAGTEGYEMPTAENMRRISGASSQPAGNTAVYNNIFDRDHDLASQSTVIDTGSGQSFALQETAFGVES